MPDDILVTELNRLVQQDRTQKERVTPVVARRFGDLGLAYELRSRLKMLCPRLFEVSFQDTQGNKAALEWWNNNPGILALYELKMIVGKGLAGDKFLPLGDLGDLTKMPYPVNRKRTRNNVEIMQATERQLDEL